MNVSKGSNSQVKERHQPYASAQCSMTAGLHEAGQLLKHNCSQAKYPSSIMQPPTSTEQLQKIANKNHTHTVDNMHYWQQKPDASKQFSGLQW